MLELPKGIWQWVSANMKDLGRVADALETIAHELAEIRKSLQDDDEDTRNEN